MLLGLTARQQERSSGDPFSLQHNQGGFSSFTFEDRRLMDKQKLDRFLESLPPNLFRCKGWVRLPEGTKLLNYIGGSYRYEPGDGDHETTLVFVGRNCDEKAIIEALNKCFA